MKPDGLELRKSLDILISRMLIGKADLSPDLLRRMVPDLGDLDDDALSQKIDYLRNKNGRKRPLR
jgi:hypothetical protein